MKKVLRSTAVPLVLGLTWFGCSSTDSPAGDPSALDAPPSGQGFQFRTEAFQVPAGTEEQDCYFFRVRDLAKAGGLPEDQPIYLHRIQMAQKVGSHHMNLFRVRTISGLDPAKGVVQRGTNGVGECFKSPNWADWPLVANTQLAGSLDWTYPENVVNKFDPDEWIMLQTHFVNATSQKMPDGTGAVSVNFWTVPEDPKNQEMGTIFATKQSIRICATNPTPRFEGSCQIHSAQPVTIIGANGHFHSRGKEFDMYTWDGTSTATPPESARFYSSSRWDDPPMPHSPDLMLQVPPNAGVWYTCSYEWHPPDDSIGCQGLNDYDKSKGTPDSQLDCCYTFGPIVEKNEHCNAFIYYYPKQDDVNCF